MLLTLLKRAVKAALHDATEQWALECGLPRELVEAMRAQRLARAAQADATADARAALALGVEDDEEERPALSMPSAARVSTTDSGDCCPPPGDESGLWNWIQQQRERRVGWADIAQALAAAGHDTNESAVRGRYRRWREKTDQPNGDSSTSS